jgi:hypothetical protein
MKNVPHGNTRRAFLQGTAAALAVPLLLTARQGTAAPLPGFKPAQKMLLDISREKR